MLYNGARYHYEKNLQGDIIGIYNYAGTKLVSYAYDAWGNILSTTYTSGYEYLANANPFRYRGYYFDRETGFYYLQSRYYDPATGRFLNADSHVNANGDLIGYNMYAYCSNNSVMHVDPTGEIWGLLLIIGFSIATAITLIIGDEIVDLTHEVIKMEDAQTNSQYVGTDIDKEIVQSQSNVPMYEYGLGCTMDYNGCEVIAVHNARILLGLNSSLAQTAAIFQDNDAMFLLGIFGSYPDHIGRVLSSMGIEYTAFYNVNKMTQDGVYIISYWNNGNLFNGIHTVAVKISNGKAQSYNKTGTKSPAQYASAGFIIGYYLGGS